MATYTVRGTAHNIIYTYTDETGKKKQHLKWSVLDSIKVPLLIANLKNYIFFPVVLQMLYFIILFLKIVLLDYVLLKMHSLLIVTLLIQRCPLLIWNM